MFVIRVASTYFKVIVKLPYVGMSSRNIFMASTYDSYKVVKPKVCTIEAYTTHSLNLIREEAAFTIPKFVGSCYLVIFNILSFQVHLAANLDFLKCSEIICPL